MAAVLHSFRPEGRRVRSLFLPVSKWRTYSMTKKILALFLALLVCVSLFSVMTAAAQPDPADTAVKTGSSRAITYYRVNRSSTYMYNSPSTSSGYKYNFPFPTGTLMEYKSTPNSTFYYVSCYYNNTTYTGYVLQTNLTRVP